MNIVMLVGNLGENAKVINTNSGNDLVKLVVATRSLSNPDQAPDWHTVVVKGKLALICQRCIKGQKVAIKGYLHTRSWVDSQGQKQYRTEVVAEEVEFHSKLGPKLEDSSEDTGTD